MAKGEFTRHFLRVMATGPELGESSLRKEPYFSPSTSCMS
jgi:hypothetical protein